MIKKLLSAVVLTAVFAPAVSFAGFYEVRQDCSVVNEKGMHLPLIRKVTEDYAVAIKFGILSTESTKEGFAFTSESDVLRAIQAYRKVVESSDNLVCAGVV